LRPNPSYNPNTISSPAGDSTAAATSSTQDDALFRDPGLPQLQKHQDFKTSAISKNYSAIGGPAEQKRSVFAKLKLIIGGDSSSGNSKESQPFILSKQFEFDYYYTSSMTFVTDGYRVAGTSSRKNTSIQIWADRQGKFEPVQKLKGRTHRIIRAVFSPNGRWLASVEDGRLNAIRIWEEREGTYELVQQLSDLPKLLRDSVIFSRDGLRLAWIYSGNKTICIWEHRQGSFEQLQVLSVASYSTHAFSLAFSHDNRQLARNHTNGNINIWAVVGGGYAQVQELTYQPGSCFSVVFSPDGRLASRWRPSRDSKLGSILIWAKNYAGKFEKVQEMAHSRGLYIFSDLSFSSDGRWLVAGCYKAFTRIWADRQGIFVHVQDLDMGGSKWLTSGFSSSVLFSPDGCRLMETRLLTSNGSAPSRNLRIFQGPEEIT
jgi:WD40 repeat protein